jgi:hypothetical protein
LQPLFEPMLLVLELSSMLKKSIKKGKEILLVMIDQRIFASAF